MVVLPKRLEGFAVATLPGASRSFDPALVTGCQVIVYSCSEVCVCVGGGESHSRAHK